MPPGHRPPCCATDAGCGVKVLGLAGWSGSGKTTLLVAMVPLFIAHGLRVSTVKHAHHGFDLDQPGKDSWRHRQAGATEVVMHETPGDEAPLPALLERMAPVDLVLVEGFKSYPHPKLEVHRPGLGRPPLWPGRQDIVAVASDAALPGCDRPVLPLDEPVAIVQWALAFLARSGALDRTA